MDELIFGYDYNDLDKLNQQLARIFKNADSEQDYSRDAIERAFADINKPVPRTVVQAHELLQIKPTTPLERAELLEEMLAISERLSVIYAEWEAFTDQLKLAMYPPKNKTVGGEKVVLIADERNMELKHNLAKFEAVKNIILYLFTHCGKIGPSIHQSILNLERDLMKSNHPA